MKKGFTLIEILAVIVVLAIISVVVMPVISGLVDKTKLSALKDSAYGLIEAGYYYNAEKANISNVRFDINNNKALSKIGDSLRYKGHVSNGTVIVSNKGEVSICITDGKNSAYKNFKDIEVTLATKKTCSIPSNTYIVYLDGTATLNELSNEQLTEELSLMKDTISKMQAKIDTLESKQNDVLKNVYPVGSIYISVNNTNPKDIYGGSWEKIQNRFLLGSGSNYSLGSTGGNSSVSYTPSGTVGNHTLTIQEMPSHHHAQATNNGKSGPTREVPAGIPYGIDYGDGVGEVPTANTGGSQAHNHPFTGTSSNINIMPPYIVVNVWKRTA